MAIVPGAASYDDPYGGFGYGGWGNQFSNGYYGVGGFDGGYGYGSSHGASGWGWDYPQGNYYGSFYNDRGMQYNQYPSFQDYNRPYSHHHHHHKGYQHHHHRDYGQHGHPYGKEYGYHHPYAGYHSYGDWYNQQSNYRNRDSYRNSQWYGADNNPSVIGATPFGPPEHRSITASKAKKRAYGNHK